MKRYCNSFFLSIRFTVLAVLLAGVSNYSIGQNSEVSDVLSKFNTFSRDNLHEKVFIHTDKETYLSNEIMWVKTYSVSEMLHTSMALSRVVYIELIDATNVPVLQAKIKMQEGKGSGSIDISRLATGTYRLRAYTRWMMNFDPRYYFEKTITIINAQRVADEKKAAERSTIKADFYPEGGYLVAGLSSTVGFKITDAFAMGLQATGTLVDQNNAQVLSFTAQAFGMGKFQFTPQKGSQYKAVITYRGETTTHALPEIITAGYVMDVKGTDKLSITVTRSSEGVQSDYVFLLAHTRQQVKSVLVSFFKENKAVFTIDKNKLGEGVSHITVFDKQKNPVCERLVFKKPANQLVIESVPQTYQFASRQEVKVSILTRDSKAAPVAANMSFSMYAIDSLQQPPNQMGILSYVYLVSDLGDRIEQPDFYFSQPDSVAADAIDNLMLTHGWRKFDWKKIINNPVSVLAYAPEYEGQIISGIARDEATGMLADTTKVYLSVAGKNPTFRAVKTDHKGNFEFSVNELYGLNPIILQANGYGVQLNESFDIRTGAGIVQNFSPAKSVEQTLTLSNIHTQVQRAFDPDLRVRIQHDTTEFYGKPTISYLLDDYVRFPTLEDVFREYVPGVIVRRPVALKKAQVFVVNNATQLFFDHEPLILLDGTPVLNTDMLLSTDAASIKKISIVNQKYFMGEVAYNGILDISTYKGNLGAFEIDPKAVVIDYDGLQQTRVFNSPDYSSAESKSSRLPDFRNMLYWQPDVETDASGSQVIRFFTSDKKGNFMGVFHGITRDGLMGSRTFTITVK